LARIALAINARSSLPRALRLTLRRGRDLRMKRGAWIVALSLAASMLTGCPRPPQVRSREACLQFECCALCLAQPQAGWIVHDGEGICVGNVAEESPESAPASCGDGRTWHFLVPDDPSLPPGAPYCPEERAPDEPEASGGEEPAGEEPAPEATEEGGAS